MLNVNWLNHIDKFVHAVFTILFYVHIWMRFEKLPCIVSYFCDFIFIFPTLLFFPSFFCLFYFIFCFFLKKRNLFFFIRFIFLMWNSVFVCVWKKLQMENDKQQYYFDSFKNWIQTVDSSPKRKLQTYSVFCLELNQREAKKMFPNQAYIMRCWYPSKWIIQEFKIINTKCLSPRAKGKEVVMFIWFTS